MEEKIDEGLIRGEGVEPPKLLEKTDLKYMKDYICKISGKIVGTGFFCKIKYEDNLIPVLMTNFHVIDDKYIKDHKQINIYINNNMKIIEISSDSLIYSSDRNKYDITIIKLNNDCGIKNYLEIEENIFRDNAEDLFKNESIYILHFPKGEEAHISYGCGIEKIHEYEISHKCITDSGSSGGPILNKLNNKIIGIHRGCYNRKNYNFGTLLKYPLNELSKKNEVLDKYHKKGIRIRFFIVDSGIRMSHIDIPSLSITVQELKQMMVEQGIIENYDYQLRYNGCVLFGEKKLEYYDIEDEEAIVVADWRLGG